MQNLSKRIEKLRRDLIARIPRIPNNKISLGALEQKDLQALIVIYLNWASRYIPPRKRGYTIATTLKKDERWKLLSRPTMKLLENVVFLGGDLSPYLSFKIKKNGFVMSDNLNPNSGINQNDRWLDKDFVLNTMGYHHFHLGEITPKGHAERTDNVLFAQITRETFDAIAFFDHSVFEQPSSISIEMTKERERLWKIHDDRILRNKPPGVYVNNPITTSGHKLPHVFYAQKCMQILQEFEGKLDDLKERFDIFKHQEVDAEEIKKQKLIWSFSYLDFGLLDQQSQKFYIFQKGPL